MVINGRHSRKPMKAILSALMVLFAFFHQVHAKAYFQTKEEMIQGAEVIAIISITDIRDSDTKGRTFFYRKSGEANVETVLKGDIPECFRIYGAGSFVCASCPIGEGRFVAFLRKDDDLWTGSNWDLSLRPINGTEVLWYVDDDNRYEMKPALLDEVIDQIKAILANKVESAKDPA
jgi:hypothetical protein